MTINWSYIDVGYQAEIPKKDMQVEIILHVGCGLPGHGESLQGYANLTLRPKKTRFPTISERLIYGEPEEAGLSIPVEAEFRESDGITGDVGQRWDIECPITFIDPATMDDGDERNDDLMKSCIERYVKTLIYIDELRAAQEEGFCQAEDS